MYRPRYLSLHEALQAVAEHLAKADPRAYSGAASALDATCNQLVQALYDGAIRSEGVFWEPTEPDPNEMPQNLPLARRPISNTYWSNEKIHQIKTDEKGRHSELDISTVSWNLNCFFCEDEWEIPYGYENIRLYSDDMQRELLRPLTPSSGGLAAAEIEPSSDGAVDPAGTPEVTYSTGGPGRRTSIHIIEPEMCRRFERGEQLPSMRAEAEYLARWLSETHLGAVPTTTKTIQNKLGDRYRQLKAAIPK